MFLAVHEAPPTLVHLCQDGVPRHPIYILFRQVRRAEDSRGQSPTLHLGQCVGASCRDVFFKINVTIESSIVRVLPSGPTVRGNVNTANYTYLPMYVFEILHVHMCMYVCMTVCMYV